MTTTSFAQNRTVLVLNSIAGWKPALLIDSSGRQDKLGCFTPDSDSAAYATCSLVWQNELYIFGGDYNRRQISKLIRYNLSVIGSLQFDFRSGACTNMAGVKLFCASIGLPLNISVVDGPRTRLAVLKLSPSQLTITITLE